MSEKTMWDWLCKRMRGEHWVGRRIENCSTKGFPDTIQRYTRGGYPRFVEFKDWSGDKKHPLTVEQLNFLNQFGGWVMVKTDKRTFYMVNSIEDLAPLMASNIRYVIKYGHKFTMSDFDTKEYLRML